jgi:hypothetical protein
VKVTGSHCDNVRFCLQRGFNCFLLYHIIDLLLSRLRAVSEQYKVRFKYEIVNGFHFIVFHAVMLTSSPKVEVFAANIS